MIAYRAIVRAHPGDSFGQPLTHGVSLPMPPASLAADLGAVPYTPPPKAAPVTPQAEIRAASAARVAAVLRVLADGSERTRAQISAATGMSEQYTQEAIRAARRKALIVTRKVAAIGKGGWDSLHRMTGATVAETPAPLHGRAEKQPLAVSGVTDAAESQRPSSGEPMKPGGVVEKRNHNRKVTQAQYRRCAAAGLSVSEVARLFGLTPTGVTCAAKRLELTFRDGRAAFMARMMEGR
jgi:hypothetical protein